MIHQDLYLVEQGRKRSHILLLPALCAFLLVVRAAQLPAQDTNGVAPPPAASDSLAFHRARADSLDSLVRIFTAASDRPMFRGLRATGGISRGVVAGGLVSLELTRPVLNDDPIVTLSGKSGDEEAMAMRDIRLTIHDMTDTVLIVEVPDSLPRGAYELSVAVLDGDTTSPDILRRPHILFVEPLVNIIGWSLLPVAVLTLLIGLVTRHTAGASGVRGLRLLFLEPQNMTYSLSRAQFVLWVAAIAWGYMFLFFARGLVEDTWTFPPINGFIYTFLISLGTLVGAQATTSTKGAKGAGQLHPSIADLMVHGGVIALERVQQILWTLIAIGIFLVTIVKNYANATVLPDIPQELLILMGISSAGYLAGKAARKPGPIIHQVRVTSGSLLMNIVGDHLSRDAVLWIDGSQRPEKPSVVTADQQDPSEFAKELQFRLEDTAPEGWLSAPHAMLIVNADGQRCEWITTPRISKVTVTGWAPAAPVPQPPAAPDTAVPAIPAGPVTLSIETEYVSSGSAIEVTGATVEGPAVRDASAPNVWIVQVTPANPAEKPYDEVRIPFGKNQAALYAWTPGS